MDVALYRGRGAELVLVHASVRPPISAEQHHGPLRYLETVEVDGHILADAWPAFADQMGTRFYAVLDESDGLRLLNPSAGTPQEQAAPAT